MSLWNAEDGIDKLEKEDVKVSEVNTLTGLHLVSEYAKCLN